MDHLRHRARPQNKLRICDDDQLRRRFEDAEQAAQRAHFLAEANPGDEQVAQHAAQATSALEEARTALDDASDFLTFLALPRPVLEELISKHPPTEQQAAEGTMFNPDTFPAALIAAASFDGMTRDEADELLPTWPAADANLLWEAAWSVQQESRVDLGKGGAVTRSCAPSWSCASGTGSRTRSSSAATAAGRTWTGRRRWHGRSGSGRCAPSATPAFRTGTRNTAETRTPTSRTRCAAPAAS